MEKVAFEVTAAQIQNYTRKKLSVEQVEEVLEIVEGDIILREDLQSSIRNAIDVVEKKKKR